MKQQHHTKKQETLDLIDKCNNTIEEVNDLNKLSENEVFRKDIKVVDKLVKYISIVNLNIKPIRFSEVRNKGKRTDSFGFLIVTFCLLTVFLGYFGKYLSRPGFYNFKGQDKYAAILYYGLAIVTIFIGIVLFFKYQKTVVKKKDRVTLLTYRYNLRLLRDVIKNMTNKEFDEIYGLI